MGRDGISTEDRRVTTVILPGPGRADLGPGQAVDEFGSALVRGQVPAVRNTKPTVSGNRSRNANRESRR